MVGSGIRRYHVWFGLLVRYQIVLLPYRHIFLLFGRVPRGPLSILHEAWTGEREYGDNDSKPVNQYIQDLETDMQNGRRYAHLHANAAQQQYTKQYNKHAKDKSFQVGQQVVVLEKDSTHKTFARWKQGTITCVRSPYSYKVQLSDGACRWLHANKLRPFCGSSAECGGHKGQTCRVWCGS